MLVSSDSVADTIDCPLISNQNDIVCDTTNQSEVRYVYVTLAKENNKYG